MADICVYLSLLAKVTRAILYENGSDSTYVFTMAHLGDSWQVRGV